MNNESKAPTVNELCLACGKTMFRKGPLDDEGRFWGMHVDDKIELDFDTVDYFYRCPHCKAKNVVISAGSGHRVSHIKKE